MTQASTNGDVLGNAENIKIFSNVLKTNVSACTSIGSFYLPQIGRIFLDMLGLYKAVSGVISETVAREGTYTEFFETFGSLTLLLRTRCYQNTKNTWTADCEKRDTETHGDIYKEGGRSGGGE